MCSKGFLRRERYVTHVRIHTGEKPFVCAVCSRGYRDKRELKKHQASHNHSGNDGSSHNGHTVGIRKANIQITETFELQTFTFCYSKIKTSSFVLVKCITKLFLPLSHTVSVCRERGGISNCIK